MFDVRRQLEQRARSSRPASSRPPLPPRYTIQLDGIFFFQNSPYPDVGGDLIFGQADGAPRQLRGMIDAAVSSNIDSGDGRNSRETKAGIPTYGASPRDVRAWCKLLKDNSLMSNS